MISPTHTHEDQTCSGPSEMAAIQSEYSKAKHSYTYVPYRGTPVLPVILLVVFYP